MPIPPEVLTVIEKLDADDQATIKKYIADITGESFEEDEGRSAPQDTNMEDDTDEEVFPPMYTSGDDTDKAAQCKMEASDLKAEGKFEEALAKYSEAVQAAQPSPLLLANRGLVLLKLGKAKAAERDCSEALKMNPDSAKALRVRGKARKELEMWEEALHDLSASQQIDFDEGTVEDLKFLTKKRLDHEKEEAQKRQDEEAKLRKRAEEIKKAQEDAKREAEEAAAQEAAGMGGMPGMGGMGGMPGMGGMGGMPGMGGMGGMPGMGGMGGMPGAGGMDMGGLMQALMSDPELAAAMQNPKVMAAFQKLLGEPGGVMGLMSNPEKVQELMMDPDVGPVMKKLFAKMGGGAMGGMPGMGAGMGGAAGADDDGVPDLGDLPDLD